MRIAICGSAPSSLPLAPFDDPNWKIWGCSPGAAASIPRADAWFELHLWGQEWLTEQYRKWMAALTCPVYMIEPKAEIPASLAYPLEEILAKFGDDARHFFTSTPAWMLAKAILLEPEEIGIWGIDMAAADEYAHQKPGCIYFLKVARDRGIKITVPPQSDLLAPPPLYGFIEADPRMTKMLTRKGELEKRIAGHQQQVTALNQQIEAHAKQEIFLRGALDDLDYHIRIGW